MHHDLNMCSDEEIIHQVLEGSVNAFEVLIARYKVHVFKIINKRIPYSETEETAHDVFIRAYRSLPSFKIKGNFKQWLSTIAVRTCYDYLRKTYRNREVPMSSLSVEHKDWLQNVLSDQSSSAFYEQGTKKEAKELLNWALNKLSAADRIVLELVYLEGLSGKEAADLLGWSLANVKVRSFRARKKLQKVLQKLIEV
jgi:RNA polymerase sigma-70 factor (ECF subfamily)